MLWLVVTGLALAQEDPPEAPEEEAVEDAEGETIAIPGAEDEALPSALDDESAISYPDEPEGIGAILDVWRNERRSVWGGSTYVKPRLSMLVGNGVHPTQLGFALGRRWWKLEGMPTFAIQVQGAGDFALAKGASTYELGLTTLAGPAAGFVALLVGPGITANHTRLGKAELPATGAVDAWALLTADARVVQVFAGLGPRWLLSDARAGASDDVHLIPGLGDELAVRAGAGITPRTVRVTFDWTRRYTAIGELDRFGIGFRFRLL